jgi:uncharacterized membrane protein YeaQ/YmgE (transglycosylase-associated protein family)
MIMLIIAWLLIGLTSGFLASKTINNSGVGLFRNLGLGTAGAVVGGAAFSAVWGQTLVADFNVWTMFVAVLGSIVVLMFYHLVIRPRTT